MKTILFIFIISFSLQADTLRDNVNSCIKDNYYYARDPFTKKDSFYFYRSSSPTKLLKTSGKKQSLYLISGYTYDSVSGKCTKTQNLGLSSEQYNFMYALFGLLFGFLLFWIVPKK